jgi:hypothetical protein
MVPELYTGCLSHRRTTCWPAAPGHLPELLRVNEHAWWDLFQTFRPSIGKCSDCTGDLRQQRTSPLVVGSRPPLPLHYGC